MLCAVIPCYRVKAHILQVLAGIGPEVDAIFVVDDACPEQSGAHVQSQCRDPRVRVLRHEQNRGVGGAMKTGFQAALQAGATYVVKLDGDGQMDARRIADLVEPLKRGLADYSKGNRFFDYRALRRMPTLRLMGNAALSFLTKATSGYWQVMDPTNGFVAIHGKVLARLPLEKIDERYFFESDMLFRLHLAGAVVRDVPMPAIYGNEQSSMRLLHVGLSFPFKHALRLAKRVIYDYYVRDFNVASLELLLGFPALLFGLGFGLYRWEDGLRSGTLTEPGGVALAALPFVMGFQLLLSALNHDISRRPEQPLHHSL